MRDLLDTGDIIGDIPRCIGISVDYPNIQFLLMKAAFLIDLYASVLADHDVARFVHFLRTKIILFARWIFCFFCIHKNTRQKYINLKFKFLYAWCVSRKMYIPMEDFE